MPYEICNASFPLEQYFANSECYFSESSYEFRSMLLILDLFRVLQYLPRYPASPSSYSYSS